MGSRNDRDEIRKLYEQHSRGLFACACSVVSSFASAEDALHQVFERMLRGGLQIEGSPVPYLYRAVRNAALNQIRNRSREVNFEDSWLEPPSGMQQSGLELQSSLKELPEEQREIILMHIWGEMSFEEVAAALEISPNTAASRYRYGLSKLREQFQVGTRSRHGQAG